MHQRVALRGKRLRIPQQRRVVAARERLGILPCHAQRALELTCALLLLHLQQGEVCRRIIAAQAQLAPQLYARSLFVEVPVVERIEVKRADRVAAYAVVRVLVHDLREPMAGLQRLRQRDQIFLFLAEHAVHRCSLLSQRKKLTAVLLRQYRSFHCAVFP